MYALREKTIFIKNFSNGKLLIIAAIVYLLLNITIAGKSVHAAPPDVSVPQTGQKGCYDATDINLTDCAGTGQDGDTLSGIAWPHPRFTANYDNTLSDHLTGLFWPRDANPANGFTTWQEALEYIRILNGQNYLGHNDWRLPNINELESLVNKGVLLVPWLESQGFTNVQTDYYWTSSTYISYPSYAWAIDMHGGIVAGRSKEDISYVWPVRGGQASTLSLPQTGQITCYDTMGKVISCAGTDQDGESQTGAVWPHPRFADNGDLTMTDRLTGLTWSKDSKAPGPALCSPGENKTQQNALDYISCLNNQKFLGNHDWRLPNRNELSSLVNRGHPNSAAYLHRQGFSNVESYGYWSSTTYVYATRNAWVVNMHDGAAAPIAKKIYGNVWPVRDGQ